MGRKRKNNTVRAYKSILQKDKDWDYGFLLNLEKKKLQRMYAYFSTSEIAYGDELVARDLRICIKLIDIIEENDAPYRYWLHESSKDQKMLTQKGDDSKYHIEFEQLRADTDFPKYVNVKNSKRFLRKELNEKDFNSFGSYVSEKASLRVLKALHLYNLIREYRMLDWWN
ncbi:hypothetical protein ONT17_09280 [Prevotella copri]|uniref:hypothetical protein n=1 Tax=Segatella copri TaxID=165179 RepID=UPI002230E67E|nr:hypothetical protein [Segatella copri]MCW4118936.1 hypothetical protein [Segatella copri]